MLAGTFANIYHILSLRSGLLIALLAYYVYRYAQRRRVHQADQAFGDRYGCLPMETKLPYKWPFALDVLKRQYDAIPSQRVLSFQSEYFDRLGPNMELRLFGQIGYLTLDPKNVESILSTRFEDFGLGSRIGGLFPLLGEGIFTQDGRAWKHSRELLRRQFARIQYQNLKVFDEHIKTLVDKLSSSIGIVDLQPAFFQFTLATTTALIFGEPVESLGNEKQEHFARSLDFASFICAVRLRLADFHWLYTPSKFTQACEAVKRYSDHFVDQALKNKDENGSRATSPRHAFILDLYDELQDRALVRDQLVNVLVAGRDTTACLMSWTFFLLVRHPVVLERLREEIRSHAQKEHGLTRAQINKMSYLRCILNETLRLYPQLPVNVRIATKTTILPSGGGPDGCSPVLIRRGTGVGFSIYHMHRLKSLYGDDANEFRPERWAGSELDNIGWGFMPFHGGPRICLGKDFALMEASYGIISVIQKFPKIRLPPGLPKEPTGQEKQVLAMLVSSAEGCKVLLN